MRTGGYLSSWRRGADRFPAGPGWLGLGEGVRGREFGPQPAFEAPGTVAAGPSSLVKLPEIDMRPSACGNKMAACQRPVYGVCIEVPGYVRIYSAAAGGRSSYRTRVSSGRSCRVSLVAALSREAAAAETPAGAGAQSQRPLGLRLGSAVRVLAPRTWEKRWRQNFVLDEAVAYD